MKEEFITYLQTIGMPTVFIERVDKMYHLFNMLYPDSIDDMFIEDYIGDEGRIYENLIFYNKDVSMQVKNFISEEKYSVFTNSMRVLSYNFQKSDYDFIKANEKSRLNIDVLKTGNMYTTLKASKENCDYLRDIFNKYYKDKIK
jgi:hypothetical protein